MKKTTIRISLALLSLLLLCFVCLGCQETGKDPGKDPTDPKAYTTLKDRLTQDPGVGLTANVPSVDEGSKASIFTYVSKGNPDKGLNSELYLGIQEGTYRVDVRLNQDPSASVLVRYREKLNGSQDWNRDGNTTIKPGNYTGKDQLTIVYTDNAMADAQTNARATTLLNIALRAFDAYCAQNLGYRVNSLGFTNLDDQYLATDVELNTTPATKPDQPADTSVAETTDETAADVPADTSAVTTPLEITPDPVEPADQWDYLGGAFSGERWFYAGRMTLMGVAMVFSVLALLWLVLIIFKHAAGGKKEKKEKKKEVKAEPKPAPVAPAPVIPAQDDAAIAAAITAAVAAMIESDPALQAEFINGFRVVSFKKKSGKTGWNR